MLTRLPQRPTSEPHGRSPSAAGLLPLPASLVAEVAARLERVRGDMTAAQFDATVQDVAHFTLRWSGAHRAVRPAAPAD